jgi:hypothetical protein
VKANPSMLNGYDTMDLKDKTISGSCSFTLKDQLNDKEDTLNIFSR